MTIEVKPEQAEAIRKAIEAGVIQDASEVVDRGLRTLGGPLKAPWSDLPAEEWIRRVREWSQSHPTDTPLLSDEAISREEIYRDRGL